MPSCGVFERLVLASNNRGKLAEFDALLAPLSITVLAQGRFEIPEAPEPYMTFLENALTKARHAARLTGLAALADDSGLCVDALNGAPGVLSARYAGEPRSDARNNEALVSALRGQTQRSAHYACVLVLVRHAGDPEPLVATGRMDGEIIEHPRGSGGFGYDPYFLLPSLGKTVAELDAALKNEISHRALAMQALFEQMRMLPGVAI
jgi:XTP/dITP diphosphohydrolase